MSDLLIARQPIFNRNQEVVAYELLYRSVKHKNNAIFLDGDFATTQVIVNTFSDIGLKDIVGNKIAFINMTRNFLVGNIPIPFAPNQVILEVLEDIEIDSTVIQGITALSLDGYSIALDDVFSEKQIAPLLDIANIAKIDLMKVNHEELPRLVTRFQQHGLKILAEKVETVVEYEMCHRLGFDLFQGYFLCRPKIVKGKRHDSSRLILLRSLAKLQDPEATFESLEEIIGADINLGYKLLNLVNSAYYFMSHEIKSIRQAIGIIGFEQLRGWITLLLMMSVQNKPHELTVIALQRARMCELIAKAAHYQYPESYFLAGMLTVLDALMDMPMSEIIEKLPLSQEIVDGLLYREGRIGKVLDAIMSYERGEMGAIFATDINTAIIKNIFLDSIKWVNEVLVKVQE
ncbi:MAG: HDOD domain-containing protein [Anaerolineaceae bacterium]|nr:HDOD domain-containing protein [Anaerolineaceae bacterium]